MAGSVDLVCASYLADARLLHVNNYPNADGGASVTRHYRTIAADGSIVALIAREATLEVRLVANDVGADDAGSRLVQWLDDSGIDHGVRCLGSMETPHLTVVTDDADTRTWFAWVDTAIQRLERIRPSIAKGSRFL